MANRVSAKGRQFIYLHEGNPMTAYLDPVGIPTIGPGLTNRSAVVTEMLGRLVPGKTKITPSLGDKVFRAVIAHDVEPFVRNGLPGATQYEFDAAASAGYNLGAARLMKWMWAKLWRAGKRDAAWDYLGSHYNTAGGKKLPGLVRRRKEEALLGKTGFYTGIDGGVAPEGVPRDNAGASPVFPDPTVKVAQRLLIARGFNPGAIDGWFGKKTKAALLAYQQAHPHLVNDGILGPATLAQLRRDAAATGDVVKQTIGQGGTGSLLAGVGAFMAGLPWPWIAAGVVVLALAWALWRTRDVWTRRFNTARGKIVEV